MKYGRYFLFACLVIYSPLQAMEYEEAGGWENLFDTTEDMQLIQEADAGIDLNVTRAVLTPEGAVENLTDPAGPIQAQTILKNPLYYRTNPPIRRNVVDLPFFQQFVERGAYGHKFTVKPFFTQTFKEYFYKTKYRIEDYIDMNQNELNNQLNDLLTVIDDVDFLPQGFTVSNVLGLFTSIYLEARNTGIMFEYERSTPLWTFSLRIPLLYSEHNLNMPEEQREIVETNPFFSDTEQNEILFARQHLIVDRLGAGDLRLNFEHLFVESHKQVFSAGIRATIPTAFAFKKGLYGTSFDPYKPAPTFNLYEDLLVPGLSTPPDQNIPLVQQNVQMLGNQIIDRLSTILLQAPGGNNHHLGFGIFSHNEMIFSPKWTLSGLASAEILLPANEQRFFIINTPQTAFDAFDWDNTDTQITQKLDFINQQFINKFFPAGYDVSVFPGLIIQSTSALTYHGRRLEITVGTDLWWKTPEKFLSIDAPTSIKQGLLDKATAKSGYGYQSMFWFSFEKRFRPGSSWKFGLQGEVTANSTGVADEWGATLFFQKQF